MLRIYLYGLLILLSLPVASNAQAPPELRLRLLFVGDVMGHDSQISSAAIIPDSLYDYSPCFELMEPMLDRSDFAVANLEVTLPGRPPYKGYPRFRSHEDLALALRYAGFDMLVTANNHSNDAGGEGVANTLRILDKYDFYHTGTFRNEAEKRAFYPLIVYRGSFKLVFLNYTYSTNGLPTQPPTIVNMIDEQQIERDMEAARAMQADAIIVVMHWGNEYERYESSSQRQLAQKLFDWGADLVVGAHPHVVQPIKEQWVTRADGTRERVVVAYSLGNFISGQRRAHTDGGLVFEVELAKDPVANTTRIADHSYALVWRYVERHADGKRTYRVLPIADFETSSPPLELPAADRSAMSSFAKSTRALLQKFDSSESRPVAAGVKNE